SSVGGSLLAAGQGAYAAANVFLDALAVYRRGSGLVGTSLAYGLWDVDTGMAGDLTEADADRLRRLGMPAIPADQALALFDVAVSAENAAVVPLHLDRAALRARGDDVPALLRGLTGGTRRPVRARAEASGSREVLRRITGLDEAERLAVLLELVQSQVAAVLGHTSAKAVEPDRAFRELGFDSLSAVELRNALRVETGLSLPATLVFDYPTARVVAAHLDAELAGTAGDPVAPVAGRAVVDDDPIVIVGMACRYPGGVASPDDLWRLVADGVDAVSAFPVDRGWDIEGIYHPEPGRPGKTIAREGGFLYDAAEFDADFFAISPREAADTDPQQRLLLEASWEAFERAGIDPHTLRGSATGVFTGLMYHDYALDVDAASTNGGSLASGRVSYVFGLEGPAVTVDTACSSSLVALHLAAQALRSGECSLALAGGVTVMATPGMFVEFNRQRGLAGDGRSKSFSASADGTGWAEGVGMLLVERLSDARRNGHPILAVVRSSAVNQDGASNGLTAPNGPSQQRVIRQALATAGLNTADVDAVEAHGTGTTLGDPIEAQALLATYGQNRPDDSPLWLGSIKSNMGHAQAAAGVAGIIKMVQAIRHGILPRTLHVDEPTPHVDWSAGQVELLTEAREWPEAGRPRRAGISSFGISGTNAHVIIEQAPDSTWSSGPTASGQVDPVDAESVTGRVEPTEAESVSGQPDPAEAESGQVQPAETESARTDIRLVPWVLSGKSAEGLRGQAERLAAFVRTGGDLAAADIGFSLATSRAAFDHRAVVSVADRDSGLTALTALDALATDGVDGNVVRGVAEGDARPPVFVFPGQGSQWTGMAVELLDSSPRFAARMKECAQALEPYVEWDLLDVLRGDGGPLERVDVVQPVLWAVMVSLTEAWREFGVEPAAVVGHSQGEIAAACVAGALTLDDGARVVAVRSRIIAEDLAGQGGMLSVALSAENVTELLTGWDGRLELAVVNGPASVVVSGETDALAELEKTLKSRNVRVRMVPVNYASHAMFVEGVRERILAELDGLDPRPSRIGFYSTVTGGLADTATLDAAYWYANLRQTVRFEQATRALLDDGFTAFVESSPHPGLLVGLGETLESHGTAAVTVGSLRRGEGGARRLLTSVAEAWAGGVRVDWSAAFRGQRARRVELPTYAFQRRRHWTDAVAAAPGADPADAAFWDAVERADLTSLADRLDLAPEKLGDLVPALSTWRRRHREDSVVDSWRYRIVWKPLAERPGKPLTGTWLVVIPSGLAAGTVAAITEGLAGHGANVVPLETDGDERAALTGQLSAEPVDGVLSLLALDTRPHPDHPTLTRGAAATIALAQAHGDAGLTAPLWCVTQGAVAVDGPGELTDPAQASLWGLGTVLGLERPGAWGGMVDLPGDLPTDLDANTVRRLCAALSGADGDQLAIRPAKTAARRMVRATLGDTPAERNWRPRGTVLITGGTGGIGAHVARWLAGNGAEHLVLTSRRGPAAEGAAELEAELTALGARVTIAACDVADRDALGRLLDSVPGELTAVMHAAGVLGTDAPLEGLTLEEFAAVGRAKAAGAAHLDELLADRPLDAFVLFSSGSSAWGGAGQSAYATANAYLDALAHRRRAGGRTATAVAWGAWDAGMIDAETGAATRRLGLTAMEPRLAIVALQKALDHDDGTLVVADIDWARFASTYTLARPRPLLDDLPDVRAALAGGEDEQPSTEPAFASGLAAMSEAERGRALLDLVHTHVAVLLGYDDSAELDPARAFKELGFDSVAAVELRTRLSAATGRKLPATVAFDHASPAALATFLQSLMRPDGAVEVPVTAELDRLEAAVAGLPPEEIERTRLTERLQALLATLNESLGTQDSIAVADRLENATADDIFDFIDKDLGMA
ncbi:type I polyketide synthase, partial [Streptomyces sp. NPDC127072]|uniref:type I polyketide synthase n=1 Tax=Streptomyces sp. NPDC127072 TaxID=3347129 RepID=UPI00364DB205